MSVEDFKSSIDYIIEDVFPRVGIQESHFLTIEYLGGEVLLVPHSELEECVRYARAALKGKVGGLRDGAQSNLIGSTRKVLELHDLFNGNIGTSWDQHTGQRHIKGSSELYQGILNKSLDALEAQRSKKPGRVFVLDSAAEPYVRQEVADAIAGGYDLVLRPIFQGGSDDVSAMSSDKMAKIMADCYRLWSENPSVRIEPFDSLFRRRNSRGSTLPDGSHAAQSFAGCPFQSDCAFKSLSLDPDGSLYICQEMADAGNYQLGNAIEQSFNDEVWRLLARRTSHLSSECSSCQWREECGGGCMNEAIEVHGDPFAKTELCSVWKSIFREIEVDIETGHNEILARELA